MVFKKLVVRRKEYAAEEEVYQPACPWCGYELEFYGFDAFFEDYNDYWECVMCKHIFTGSEISQK